MHGFSTRAVSVGAAAVAFAVIATGPAQARIASGLGQMEEISRPADARTGALENDSDTVSIAVTTSYAQDKTRVLTQAFDFAGFFAPVVDAPMVNAAKAGSAVPIKFSLGGFQGYDIFAPGTRSRAPSPSRASPWPRPAVA